MSHPVKRSILVDGMTRTYLRVALAGETTGRALVLVLHGSNQSADAISSIFGQNFDSLASRGYRRCVPRWISRGLERRPGHVDFSCAQE
jgi:hypothetical protein